MDELLWRLPALAAAHLRLSLTALALGLVLSLPLGVLLHRAPRWKGGVLAAVGVVQTIPSLALLAFMVPAIGAIAPVVEAIAGVRPSAIGAGPALVALTVYGVLPILQNTVAGLAGVEPALVEAARGVGMTPRQRLFRVELPLALPVIVAGVRTAAVWTIGTAVLATPIGASSLGDYIFIGLQTRNHASIAVGCVASAVLALALDVWIRTLERAARERRRRRMLGLALGLLGAWAAAFTPLLRSGGVDAKVARVGAKAFTEAYVMAEIFAGRLSDAGFETQQVGSLGSTVIFDALRSGDIDLYLDFSGTILANVMKVEAPPGGRRAVREAVQVWLEETHDIRVGAVLGYENRYAFALRRDQADRLGLRRLSDLAGPDSRLSLAASFEFFDRPEWSAVRRIYGLHFRDRTAMEQALAYEAVKSEARDVVVAYSTDARIDSFDLVLLEDDRGAIPPYEALILVRGAFADTHPEAMIALAELEGAFTEESVRRLNRGVDEEGRSPAAVARAWERDRSTGAERAPSLSSTPEMGEEHSP